MFDEAIQSGQLADEVGARELCKEKKREAERAGIGRINKLLKALDRSGVHHKSTLLLAPIDNLLFEGGLVAALRPRGYEVKLPQ